ncbi:hypothetical protein KUTeg_015773 [Tegillarca granosa]|uniref:SET domain-containing protein n=1 Tax=Tegillarca granosa TaxID=220873 RepID=A0ABQ9ET14_TEGGR|nr:hypothetical protein KUTeg_015773 [Tegillarca granosa]
MYRLVPTLILLLYFELCFCFPPNPESAPGSKSHESITRLGVYGAVANYLKDKKHVTGIFDTNYDRIKEYFISGHYELVSLRGKIEQEAKSKYLKIPALRNLIGQYLYTLQSFYCNTNWVEMRGGTAYLDLGLQNMELVDIATPSSHNDHGKCSHGGPRDSTRTTTANCGINKETSDSFLSPHNHLHEDAALAATKATEHFISGDGSGLVNVFSGKLFEIVFSITKKTSKSLGFVIDVTGSMHKEINDVKIAATDKVKNPVFEPAYYVLSTFSDPENLTTGYVTEYSSNIIEKITNLTVFGGDDCREYAHSGIAKGIFLSSYDSILYLFTDASSKDGHRAQEIINLATEKRIQIDFLLTGTCRRRRRRRSGIVKETKQRYKRQSGFDPDFYRIASATGGTVYDVTSGNLSQVLEKLLQTSFPNTSEGLSLDQVNIDYKSRPENMSNSLQFYVDNKATKLQIQLTGVQSMSQVELMHPNAGLVNVTTSNTTSGLADVINIHVSNNIPMKRKRISPIQDALYWCRAKRDKDGFVIKFINNFIGSGVFTQKKFLKGDFLLEYEGNFYDATYSHGKGRMINDAVGKNINCIPKVVIVDKNPRICFFAAKDLELHAELRYNYGEGLSLPWRQKGSVTGNWTITPKLYNQIILNVTGKSVVDFTYKIMSKGADGYLYKNFFFKILGTDADGSILTRIKWLRISPVQVQLTLVPVYGELLVNQESELSYKIKNVGVSTESFLSKLTDNQGLSVSLTSRNHTVNATSEVQDEFTIIPTTIGNIGTCCLDIVDLYVLDTDGYLATCRLNFRENGYATTVDNVVSDVKNATTKEFDSDNLNVVAIAVGVSAAVVVVIILIVFKLIVQHFGSSAKVKDPSILYSTPKAPDKVMSVHFNPNNEALQRFESVIDDIVKSNNNVQRDRAGEAKISFNGEQIRQGIKDAEILDIASPSENTCKNTLNDQQYRKISGHCPDNIIEVNKLTSGYKSGQNVNKPKSDFVDYSSGNNRFYSIQLRLSESNETLQTLSKYIYVTSVQHPTCKIVYEDGECLLDEVTPDNCKHFKWLAITETTYSSISLSSVTLSNEDVNTQLKNNQRIQII